MRNKGRLIVFCGIDGSGKTTQINLLHEWLLAKKQAVILTKQPTDWYRRNELIRDYLDQGIVRLDVRTLALMSAADRQIHLNSVIIPALEREEWVICDRYVYSAYAYFTARGVEDEFLRTINFDIPTPDITFFLHLPGDLANRRIQKRGTLAMKHEEKDIRFLDIVADKYKASTNNSFRIIPADQSVSEIHTNIINTIERFIK